MRLTVQRKLSIYPLDKYRVQSDIYHTAGERKARRKGGNDMRFEVRAAVRGAMGANVYEMDGADEALRLFDALAVASKMILIYDQVLLIEMDGEKEIMVERYRYWNDELLRETRYQQLLDELHPAARV